jgi:hypothetical protein
MRTQSAAVALSILVTLLAGCGGSSPGEQTPTGAASPDDVGSDNADPTGSAATTSSGESGAHSTGSNGDAGTQIHAWDGFRLPVPFPTFHVPVQLLVDADAGSE